MSITNIIEINFNGNRMAFVDSEYRLDSGMYLKFMDIDLPEAYQVHFANRQQGATFESIGNADGVRIPDNVWTSKEPIFAWVYLHPTNDSAVTKYEVRIIKKVRADLPNGVEPTPYEQTVIDEAISALNTAVEKTSADAEQTAADAETASQAAQTATEAKDTAVEASTSAARSEQNAETSATNAAESESSAATSATNAFNSADRAEQAAQNAGYMFFDIDENGDLIYERTTSVDVDFSIEDGDLYVEVIA